MPVLLEPTYCAALKLRLAQLSLNLADNRSQPQKKENRSSIVQLLVAASMSSIETSLLSLSLGKSTIAARDNTASTNSLSENLDCLRQSERAARSVSSVHRNPGTIDIFICINPRYLLV